MRSTTRCISLLALLAAALSQAQTKPAAIDLRAEAAPAVRALVFLSTGGAALATLDPATLAYDPAAKALACRIPPPAAAALPVVVQETGIVQENGSFVLTQVPAAVLYVAKNGLVLAPNAQNYTLRGATVSLAAAQGWAADTEVTVAYFAAPSAAKP